MLNHCRTVKRQLLINIFELAHRDSKTSTQWVVHSVLVELLINPPPDFSVGLVYATQHEPGYRYARQFLVQLLSKPNPELADGPIEVFSGDIFPSLDLQHHVVLQQAPFYAHLKRAGVQVHLVIYGLLPVLMPHAFPEGTSDIHDRWLRVLAQGDGMQCISCAVADEMAEWLSVNGPKRLRPFKLGWFHLGADVMRSVLTKGLPATVDDMLDTLVHRPAFSMVGTIEPRKGQLQTLAAFERFWNEDVDVNLVMIGKHGWNIDSLVEMPHNHVKRDRRLLWLDGVSDEYLEKVYAASDCSIAASEDEGFGLPLIGAAQHELPIITHDISVFREVAGNHTLYFSGATSDTLANAVEEWLTLDKAGAAPQSNVVPWLTWKQNTQNLLDIILRGHWYRQWLPDGVYRFAGGDNRLSTRVGKRAGREMVSTRKAGYLVFGPYLSLASGHYRVVIRGELGGTTEARMDAAVDQGQCILVESALREPDAGDHLPVLPTELDALCTDLEIRVWVNSRTNLSISVIEVTPRLDN